MTSTTAHRANGGQTVLVLLPVYNGTRFLNAQLDSIFSQRDVFVHLLCRDDGSTDNSPNLLREAQGRWPRQVHLLEDDLGNLGVSSCFSRLMTAALALRQQDSTPFAYIALCDQDDLWHSDKLSTCLSCLRELERARPGQPVLVHSDLRVIAEDGCEIAPSLARYQGLRVDLTGFAPQLLSNTVTGCTALMNRELIERALPVPEHAIMHDWWLSLVASALGCRHYVDKPLIDYRQHASNTVGAKAREDESTDTGVFWWMLSGHNVAINRRYAAQALAVVQRLKTSLSWRQRLAARLVTLLRLPLPPLHELIHHVVRRL
jgi:glycosyltransferase involved in cell wall biosynthesis